MILSATIVIFRRTDGAEKEDGIAVFPEQDKMVIVDHDGKVVPYPIFYFTLYYEYGTIFYEGRTLKKEINDDNS